MWIVFLVYAVIADMTRIAIGSCNGQFNRTNPRIYESIAEENPDLYIWLGDSVYADRAAYPDSMDFKHVPLWREIVKSFKNSPEYTLLRSTCKITGIWDDHDYGENDADHTFILKSIGQEIFLDFLDESIDHEGIYRTYEIDPRIKLIMLDVRYFRVKEHDILGEKQWRWLEEQLKDPRELVLIASGLQINVEDRFAITEQWDEPSRLRLLKMLENIPGVIFLTGDIHFGEILTNDCWEYRMLEFTASGLTHTEATTYGPISYWFLSVSNAMSYHKNLRVLKMHYGMLEIDWSNDMIYLRLKDSFGILLTEESMRISDLKKKIVNKPEICNEDRVYRHVTHICSCIAVLHLPLLIFIAATIICLRKYTNSY